MLNRLQGVFASSQSNNVRYVVIGGIAAVLHGVPRATFDLDLPDPASSPAPFIAPPEAGRGIPGSQATGWNLPGPFPS